MVLLSSALFVWWENYVSLHIYTEAPNEPPIIMPINSSWSSDNV